ncbi:unnamed protein product [Prorocentrum cordatum]|uniref:Uncharacterized protein n=1 Tax=Prorocentrum cordatum TaxID=2364126 RepID=A0ABN9W3E2_9DINO|nr:unnamed protein product [Polarella glacialis]
MHIGLHISTRISREPMLRTRSGVMPRGAGRAGRAAQLDLQTRRELRPGQTTRRRPSRGHEGALGCPAKTPTEAPGKSTWSDLLKPRRRARRRIWTASDYNGPPPGSSLPRSRPAPATGDEGGNVLGGGGGGRAARGGGEGGAGRGAPSVAPEPEEGAMPLPTRGAEARRGAHRRGWLPAAPCSASRRAPRAAGLARCCRRPLLDDGDVVHGRPTTRAARQGLITND